ncbi:MSH3 [Candida pseudojiufengensis]|uniref:MSH3 n=1 Tax=Candida pseudojiufengensis TaxID=497109 RepID=UPI0022244FCE|nr:MSH3 [Candida pseudojiufengensis]KAI5961024.1 MSH3 [Candida pseudojiufengensis]
MTPKKKQSSISHFFTSQKQNSSSPESKSSSSHQNSQNGGSFSKSPELNGLNQYSFQNEKDQHSSGPVDLDQENSPAFSQPISQTNANGNQVDSTSQDHIQNGVDQIENSNHNQEQNHVLPQKRPISSPSKYTYKSRKLEKKKEEESSTTASPTNSKSTKSSKKSKLTPLEHQILELTEANPDKILLIQVGYKYKIYGQKQALHVSKCLNIMYIENKEDLRFSYCSFPDNRLHINLQRILNSNVKIGIVKQMESAIIKEIDKIGKSGDLMKREITGVYTKGTYMSDEFIGSNLIPNSIEEENPNYIICINEINEKEFAIVAVQPLTGEIIWDEFHDSISREEMETRLLYLRPSEVLVVNNQDKINGSTLKCLKLINHDLKIEHKQANTDELSNYLQDDILQYYQINFSKAIQECIINLINYLSEFKLNNIFTIPQNISTFKDSRKYMILPANTLTSLEIFQNSTDPNTTRGTLVWLLNHTKTRFGNRLLNKWISRPLIDKNQILLRLKAVEELCKFNHIIDSLTQQLNKIGKNLDLEELLIKIHYSATTHSNRINRKQIFLMLQSFNDVLKIIKSFEKSISDPNSKLKSKILNDILLELLELSKTDVIYNLISMINPSYLLNESKDPFVQKTTFFNLSNNGEGFNEIEKEFENLKKIDQEFEIELRNIRKLLNRPQLNYVTAQREPYLIEIRNGSNIPTDFIKINSTKTVSRYRNKEIIKLIKLKSYHQELLIQKCDFAFLQFCQILDSQYSFLQTIVKNLSILDSLLSLSYYSNNNLKTQPKLSDDLIIDVKQARHPIIEELRNDQTYVSNNINISYDKNRVLIITGPNMGGKSSYVKTIALFTIMTQIGCYLPCEFANMGIFDSIFIRMGASDNILKGKSTFMIEMLECNSIISRLTNRSLIILDEIGRGTGTTDGISLAFSILKYLIEIEYKPLILFITHYPSLNILENEYPNQVKNYHMGFQEVQNTTKDKDSFPEIIFLYNLVSGVINNSYGLNVAKLAGIPIDIINNAFKISEDLKHEIEISNNDENYKFLKQLKDLLNSNDINNESINNLLNL